MFDFDQLRSREEQRLLLVVASWNEAKDQLQKAVALTETREREYREASEDVRRRLDALDMVKSMARELGNVVSAERSLKASEKQPMLSAHEKAFEDTEVARKALTQAPIPGGGTESSGLDGLLHTSSRPLFPSHVRSRFGRLSILQ